MLLPFRAAALACVVCLVPTLACAQSLENFYRGKTVNVIIGYPPAGANDFYARAVARHIGKHIPGNPTVIPRNMPGGGSLVAANHIFNVAPKDGTTLGLIVPTAPIEEKQILRIVANATEVGKMILSTPDTPTERITALRRAFDATTQDPAFVAELKAQRVELGPMPGEELQKLVAEVGAVPPDIIEKVKAIYPLN